MIETEDLILDKAEFLDWMEMYDNVYCMGKRVCEENCLAVLSPHIAAEWDYEKNRELTPALVTNHSSIFHDM